MKNLSFTLLIITFLVLTTVPCAVFALSSDATKVADFKADNVSFNQKTGTMVYLGHVDMQQGSTRLVADQVVVYKDEQGNTDKVVATGKPAHYRTLPDNQKNPVDASGDTIEYYPQKKIAIVMGNGVVTQAKNSLKGPHLIYDMVKQTVSSIPSQVQKSAQTALTLQPQEDLPGQ